jgi:hypothetical protein
MLNFTKGFIVIGMLAMLETAYAGCKPITIIAPDGSMTVCSVCSDGKVIICT